MMVTKFNGETGECQGSFSCQEGEVQSMPSVYPEVFIAGAFDASTFWLVDGQPARRPRLVMRSKTVLVADDLDLCRMTGIPPGTVFNVCNLAVPRTDPSRDVVTATIDDGVFEWSTALPGRYQFTLLPPFPWQALQFEVNAYAV